MFIGFILKLIGDWIVDILSTLMCGFYSLILRSFYFKPIFTSVFERMLLLLQGNYFLYNVCMV